jgi:hypothetical protein
VWIVESTGDTEEPCGVPTANSKGSEQNDGCEWPRTIDLRRDLPIALHSCPHASSTTGSSFPPLASDNLTRLRWRIPSSQVFGVLGDWNEMKRRTHSESGFDNFSAGSCRIPSCIKRESKAITECTIGDSSCQCMGRIYETHLHDSELSLGAQVLLISYRRISLGTICGVFMTWRCLGCPSQDRAVLARGCPSANDINDRAHRLI